MSEIHQQDWLYTLVLPPDSRSPFIARGILHSFLDAYHLAEGIEDTARLITSELVTNAHLHTQAPFLYHLNRIGQDRIRIGVWDSDPHLPAGFTTHGIRNTRRTEYNPHNNQSHEGEHSHHDWQEGNWQAENGRGLTLLRETAAAYGGYLQHHPNTPTPNGNANPRPILGKLLWADITRTAD